MCNRMVCCIIVRLMQAGKSRIIDTILPTPGFTCARARGQSVLGSLSRDRERETEEKLKSFGPL